MAAESDEAQPKETSRKHDGRTADALVEFMSRDWGEPPALRGRHPAREHHARRRAAISAAFPGRPLVVPAGTLKVRANDTDYRFRPGSDFFWLCGHDEPDSVLVLHPQSDTHRAVLYVEPRADRSTSAFFTNARSGELWVGPRRGVAEAAAHLDIETAPIGRLEDDLEGLNAPLVVRDVDAELDAAIPANDDDNTLATALSELRLVKDDFEVQQLQVAVNATIHAFEDVVRALPEAMEQGERVIEGVFNLRARVEGNDVGYGTIAASGSHATILHWTRNDGEVRSGELLLLDAGVECNQLYTADVTRTLPVNGRFTSTQRRLYDMVLRAQRAGIAAVKPGAEFLDPHRAAMRVLAEGLDELGLLPCSVEESLRDDRQLHRRYTLHGTSHMLGLDVHDCAHAREQEYRGGTLRPGNVLTVEPGLYFQANDLTVPEELRGIGIRIEDDVLVTEHGCRVLSGALPTDADDIERWMASLRDGNPELRQPL
ncbi:MAG: aminopeptidase P family protein [Candidatus Dormibacteria bacterium]